MPESNILIIGAGPAGLSTAGALKHAGLESTILDRSDHIGQSWDQRYDRLHLHTVRAFSGLAHFPIPPTYPKYLSKDQYASYLRAYATHFDLKVIPDTPVQCVRQEHMDGRSIWAVDSGSETWLARVVVIATGQYGQPVWPNFPSLDQYRGEMLHSSSYRSGRVFQDRRVLVVGAGNSGMEIAVDLVEQGARQVAVSMRSVPPVVPRDFLGTPAQVFAIMMNSFPPAVSDGVGKFFARLAFGDLTRYGFPSPSWGAFRSHRPPVIDVGFVPALKAGKVGVRPEIASFTSTGVVFRDQRAEEFDAVVFATGFRSGLEQLLEPPGLLDKNGIPLFPSGAPTACPGLYFMGFYESLRGFLYESNLTSQQLARQIKAFDLKRKPEAG